MKQLLQRLDNGETRLVDVPVPGASGQSLVVESRASLISAGTERMLVEFGRAGLLDKARQQPDKVRQVVDKMRTDGVAATLEELSRRGHRVERAGGWEHGRVLAATHRPTDGACAAAASPRFRTAYAIALP